jgi:nicotinamidase/pyrazinamidase
MKKALIVIDLQNDFCPGGALAVDEGDQIVPGINRLAGSFDLVAATRDWHPADHVSFASNHPDRKVQDIIDCEGIEQILWPDHCIQGSRGADFHPDFDVRPLNLIIHKGTGSRLDSYSAFFENDHRTPTGLAAYLKDLDAEELYFCGLATDYCVYYSVLDALGLGFRVHLLEDCVRGVGFPPGSIEERLRDMRAKGALLLNSGDL